MAKTKIAWTDRTWNPLCGCTHASRGCQSCYAERMAARLAAMADADIRADRDPGRKKHYLGVIDPQTQKWNGNVALIEEALEDPFAWAKPCRVFVDSMADLFHEKVPFTFIDRVFAVMALCPQHTFQILTKRADRMLEYFRLRENGFVGGAEVRVYEFVHQLHNRFGRMRGPLLDAGWTVTRTRDDGEFKDVNIEYGGELPLPNVWVGVSAEDQDAADWRVPLLLQVPAAVRFVSCEPLLGPVNLRRYLCCPWCANEKPKTDGCGTTYHTIHGTDMPCPTKGRGQAVHNIDQVIVGAETGPQRRLMNERDACSLRDQCRDAGVAFFFKQGSGLHPQEHGTLEGVEWHEFPMT